MQRMSKIHWYSRLLCRPFCFGAVTFELSNNKKHTFKKVLHQILCFFLSHMEKIWKVELWGGPLFLVQPALSFHCSAATVACRQLACFLFSSQLCATVACRWIGPPQLLNFSVCDKTFVQNLLKCMFFIIWQFKSHSSKTKWPTKNMRIYVLIHRIKNGSYTSTASAASWLHGVFLPKQFVGLGRQSAAQKKNTQLKVMDL